jgi:hypothetical protein
VADGAPRDARFLPLRVAHTLRSPPCPAGFYIWNHEAPRTMWNTLASGGIVLAVFACTLFPVARTPSAHSFRSHSLILSFSLS